MEGIEIKRYTVSARGINSALVKEDEVAVGLGEVAELACVAIDPAEQRVFVQRLSESDITAVAH